MGLMVPFICLLIGLLFLYSFLLLVYRSFFLKLKPFHFQEYTSRKNNFFSVIIPARDEQASIEGCLRTILSQAYQPSCFEVIVIDDYSRDETAAVVESLQTEFSNLKLIRLESVLGNKRINSYKKKAIEIGIESCRGEWIVTTDADCRVGKHWLSSLNAFIGSYDPYAVAAPVCFFYEHTFISLFQCMDFMSLQGVTAAAVSAGLHNMCNGANFAYRKDIFSQVNGFHGIDQLASGDDMMLLDKIRKKYPSKIRYLFSQDAIVSTYGMKTWADFLNQRIRWASKTGQLKDWKIKLVLYGIYAFNFFLLVFFFLGFLHPQLWLLWLLLMGVKTLSEIIFMVPVCRFYAMSPLLKRFPLLEPFHLIYIVLAGWLGMFGHYKWKNRTVH